MIQSKGISIQKAAPMADNHKNCFSDIENGIKNVKIIELKKIDDLL